MLLLNIIWLLIDIGIRVKYCSISILNIFIQYDKTTKIIISTKWELGNSLVHLSAFHFVKRWKKQKTNIVREDWQFYPVDESRSEVCLPYFFFKMKRVFLALCNSITASNRWSSYNYISEAFQIGCRLYIVKIDVILFSRKKKKRKK